MPNVLLEADYEKARHRYAAALANLVPLVQRMAIGTLAEVLPGARAIEAFGELNEDWLPTLRIQRVLGVGGEVLVDIADGHQDAAVESAVDTVEVEYLDVLIDLTGDEYMGATMIG